MIIYGLYIFLYLTREIYFYHLKNVAWIFLRARANQQYLNKKQTQLLGSK